MSNLTNVMDTTGSSAERLLNQRSDHLAGTGGFSGLVTIIESA